MLLLLLLLEAVVCRVRDVDTASSLLLLLLLLELFSVVWCVRDVDNSSYFLLLLLLLLELLSVIV